MTVRRPPFVVDQVPVHGTRHPSYIVLHTTEGLGTVESFAHYFRSTPEGLGSAFLVERSGRTGRYVKDLADRTYAQANQNTVCIAIEQEGFANTTGFAWKLKYRRQLYAAAWLCAWLCDQLGIDPEVAGSEKTGRRYTRSTGITQHRWLPLNDHDDCGPGYPMDLVVSLAKKWVRTGGPTLSTRIFIKTGHRP